MKKMTVVFTVMVVFASIASAQPAVSLYVDAAPNRYGSSDYAPWEAAAFAAAASGTFVNMASSYNPANAGTTNFEIQDEVVYSFGDLGKRLTWVYYVAGETTTSLAGRFEISLSNTWDGDYLDFYMDYYGSTWLEPTSWINYDADNDGNIDGVIGTAGMAWWGAYNTNTQAELDADIADWIQADETWTFCVRLDGTNTCCITSYREGVVVPVPGAVLLGSIGVGLVGWFKRRKSF